MGKGTVEGGASLEGRSVASGKGKRDVLWSVLPGRKLTGLLAGLSSGGALWDYLCERTEQL